MRKITIGETVVLLMDIKSYDTPFLANIGDVFTVVDTEVDPHMPSGYNVKLQGYGSVVAIDRSVVIHYEDWKKIHNAVIDRALMKVSL